MFDTSTCPGCRQVLNNGLYSKFRSALESSQYWMKRPKSVMARAASYANGIYGFAAEGAPMEFQKIENKIRKRFGGEATGSARMVYTDGRGVLDMHDGAVGVMIVTVDGVTGSMPWRYIYVVFRGSAGGRSSVDSGWDESGDHNIDWRANFENETARVPWGPPDAKAHQGFLAIYMSMRTGLRAAIAQAVRDTAPGATPLVVVCGHSLGAGISQICAHDLHFSGLAKAACFPFCPPRAGNLGFVRSFNAEISDKQVYYPTERNSYTYAISSVQGLDPVSIGQKRGAMRGVVPNEGTVVVDGGGLIARGMYAAGFKHDDLTAEIEAEERMLYGEVASKSVRKKRQVQKQAQFYHIKRIWLIQLTGFHLPGWVETNAYSSFH